jgi:hypothetical protein
MRVFLAVDRARYRLAGWVESRPAWLQMLLLGVWAVLLGGTFALVALWAQAALH